MAEIIRTYFDYYGDYVEEWDEEELEEANHIAYESYKSESDSYYWGD